MHEPRREKSQSVRWRGRRSESTGLDVVSYDAASGRHANFAAEGSCMIRARGAPRRSPSDGSASGKISATGSYRLDRLALLHGEAPPPRTWQTRPTRRAIDRSKRRRRDPISPPRLAPGRNAHATGAKTLNPLSHTKLKAKGSAPCSNPAPHEPSPPANSRKPTRGLGRDEMERRGVTAAIRLRRKPRPTDVTAAPIYGGPTRAPTEPARAAGLATICFRNRLEAAPLVTPGW